MVNLTNYQIILNKNTFHDFWVLTMQFMIGKEKNKTKKADHNSYWHGNRKIETVLF